MNLYLRWSLSLAHSMIIFLNVAKILVKNINSTVDPISYLETRTCITDFVITAVEIKPIVSHLNNSAGAYEVLPSDI